MYGGISTADVKAFSYPNIVSFDAVKIGRNELFVACPPSQLNNPEVTITKKAVDPIVYQPCAYGILIHSMWGEESEDKVFEEYKRINAIIMFEKASRMKLRFNTQRGVLSVEDLWDLPLIQLDNIAIALNKKLQESKTESFIKTRTKDTTELELKFNIAKHIIDVKLQEQEDRLLESEKKAKRQKILDLMAKKQDAELEGKSLEELAKELEALN